MKLMDNEAIIPSLEKAAEISLGILGIMGIESTDDYFKGAKATYESIIEAFKRQKDFVEAVPEDFIWEWVRKNQENNSQVILMMADWQIEKKKDGDSDGECKKM